MGRGAGLAAGRGAGCGSSAVPPHARVHADGTADGALPEWKRRLLEARGTAEESAPADTPARVSVPPLGPGKGGKRAADAAAAGGRGRGGGAGGRGGGGGRGGDFGSAQHARHAQSANQEAADAAKGLLRQAGGDLTMATLVERLYRLDPCHKATLAAGGGPKSWFTRTAAESAGQLVTKFVGITSGQERILLG
mmetsp:Transcript_39819/g.104574  ORF Transcript_39819/g.104574 Transcript_39819/m.104574 type:complete len:194 (-) Transcript_39819:440-1021(-)